MVKTRVQILADTSAGQLKYAGYRNAVREIWRTEGVAGFYKGIVASYWGASESAIQWVVYERLKREASERPQGASTSDMFWLAAASKLVATLATYPHEVARTRLREQARGGVFKYTGMVQTLKLINAEEGWKGLYAGCGTHCARVVPNSAILFVTYEVVTAWLDRLERATEAARLERDAGSGVVA